MKTVLGFVSVAFVSYGMVAAVEESVGAWQPTFEKFRDPFAFVPPESTAIKEPPNRTYGAEWLLAATRHRERAQALAASGRYQDVLRACEEGLQSVRDILKNEDLLDRAAPSGTERVRFELLRLKRAAGRIVQRQQVEREFAQWKLRLSGVYAEAHSARALLNGRQLQAGDSIAARDGTQAIVREIQPGRVILEYKGFAVSLEVE